MVLMSAFCAHTVRYKLRIISLVLVYFCVQDTFLVNLFYYAEKSETELTASVLKKKKSKTHKRLKEHFLISQNRTKCANIRGSPLFQATYNRKQLNQLILCQFDAKGPFLFHVRQSHALFLPPAS